jgi:hypothetical protein
MGALIKKSEARSGRHSFETSGPSYRFGLSIRQRNRPVLPPQSSKLAGMSLHGVRRDKAALSSGVQIPPGNRSSRKQPEQSWR